MKKKILNITLRSKYHINRYGKYLENILISVFKNKSLKHQPVFIIGAPRTGSTILYEYITNYLDVQYINNYTSNFYEILYLSSIISKILLGDKSHYCFKSRHGVTKGFRAPSECGQFWYRWFPRNRHFVDYNELNKKQMMEIYSTVAAITNTFDKSIVFKNMNCGQRLRIIKEIFPECKIIYMKREIQQVAQSIIKVREDVYNDRNKWWSIMPKEYKELFDKDYIEQVVYQIYYIQKQIECDLNLFNKENIKILEYKNFCSNPKEEIEDISRLINARKKKGVKRINRNRLKYSQEIKIDYETYAKLEMTIKSLKW